MKERNRREKVMEENKNIEEELEQTATADAKSDAADATADGSTDKTSKGDKKKLKKAEDRITELEAELEKAKASAAESDDKYVRLYAEYDNFRRRSQKEKEGIYADAYIDALTQILPVLDNLERAAQYGTADAENPLAKGLELTLKSFADTMEKMGVTEIPALGEKFDPNVHNAVMHVDDDSFGENEVVEVLMKGYIKGDKVLRYSMVKVAN